jgi:hypothetical protein
VNDQSPVPFVLWDPAAAWPAGRKLIWALLAVVVIMAQGRPFLHSIMTGWNEGNDFFQDWASARNLLQGRPVYLPLSTAMSLYYPRQSGQEPPRIHLPWNAHPPVSIMAILPMGYLDYPAAGTLWNLLSLLALAVGLGFIIRELKLPIAAWSTFPIVALVLICSPIRTQISQGQWNAELLLLLILAWAADRRGKSAHAGAIVAVAGALKLFPMFFLLFFAVRRQWRAVIAGAVCMAGIVLLSVLVLGADAYHDYYNRVLPSLGEFRSALPNASILAFWTKNFSKGASHYGLFANPVIRAPRLAGAGIILSYAAVLATWCIYVLRLNRSGKTHGYDLSFSLTLVAMLLLTPICWDHYLLLLALPLALIWSELGASNLQKLAFLVLVTAVWVGPHELWKAGGVDLLRDFPDFQEVPPSTYLIRRPLFVPFFLSLHFYALVASYIWLVFLSSRQLAQYSDALRHDPGAKASKPEREVAATTKA